jgi:predicted phosphodiesterase
LGTSDLLYRRDKEHDRMKALIFGDVHGNLPALEEMLGKEKGNYDLMISHGDVVNYGPWSNECVQLLKNLDCICLKGNHEQAYINGFYPGENPLVKEFFQQTIKDFKHLEEIKKYGESYLLGSYEIAHTINNTYYFPDTDTSDLKLEKNTIIGHSHYAFYKTLGNGKTLINTGSVGQNRKDLRIINYVLLNTNDDAVEMRSLLYDPSMVIQEMKTRAYPESCIAYYQNKLSF